VLPWLRYIKGLAGSCNFNLLVLVGQCRIKVSGHQSVNGVGGGSETIGEEDDPGEEPEC